MPGLEGFFVLIADNGVELNPNSVPGLEIIAYSGGQSEIENRYAVNALTGQSIFQGTIQTPTDLILTFGFQGGTFGLLDYQKLQRRVAQMVLPQSPSPSQGRRLRVQYRLRDYLNAHVYANWGEVAPVIGNTVALEAKMRYAGGLNEYTVDNLAIFPLVLRFRADVYPYVYELQSGGDGLLEFQLANLNATVQETTQRALLYNASTGLGSPATGLIRFASSTIPVTSTSYNRVNGDFYAAAGDGSTTTQIQTPLNIFTVTGHTGGALLPPSLPRSGGIGKGIEAALLGTSVIDGTAYAWVQNPGGAESLQRTTNVERPISGDSGAQMNYGYADYVNPPDGAGVTALDNLGFVLFGQFGRGFRGNVSGYTYSGYSNLTDSNSAGTFPFERWVQMTDGYGNRLKITAAVAVTANPTKGLIIGGTFSNINRWSLTATSSSFSTTKVFSAPYLQIIQYNPTGGPGGTPTYEPYPVGNPFTAPVANAGGLGAFSNGRALVFTADRKLWISNAPIEPNYAGGWTEISVPIGGTGAQWEGVLYPTPDSAGRLYVYSSRDDIISAPSTTGRVLEIYSVQFDRAGFIQTTNLQAIEANTIVAARRFDGANATTVTFTANPKNPSATGFKWRYQSSGATNTLFYDGSTYSPVRVKCGQIGTTPGATGMTLRNLTTGKQIIFRPGTATNSLLNLDRNDGGIVQYDANGLRTNFTTGTPSDLDSFVLVPGSNQFEILSDVTITTPPSIFYRIFHASFDAGAGE